MLGLYKTIMRGGAPVLKSLLKNRAAKGKEDPARLPERMGVPGRARPEGPLLWIHAASVGESQSTLTLIEAINTAYTNLDILVTTGTVTSAELMARRLPENAFHQFYPLDNPAWVRRFLDHWKPDCALWMESEIWPGMLSEIRERKIPAALVNGRLSPRSFSRWKKAGKQIGALLGTFSVCLVQTGEDACHFEELGAGKVIVTDNLKYSSSPLPCDEAGLKALTEAIGKRPCWVYASTHAGEEALACRVHERLKQDIPSLLTILVPRHPHRGPEVMDTCLDAILNAHRRGDDLKLPFADDDIYIADTLGELGLFYRLCDIACIGRSFSDDGGGGHNPIEAAQLGCAVLHGPHVQNLATIYQEMDTAHAAIRLTDEDQFVEELGKLFKEPDYRKERQEKAARFAHDKATVLERVMTELEPVLAQLKEKPGA